jgi:hypothetical protein
LLWIVVLVGTIVTVDAAALDELTDLADLDGYRAG